uniref:Uncharacterized protein n=1 Tax=Meloidogyne enterolobii TaxID=390850 RepID=A0A6V7TWN0_MELEN|nr:unnamed protein product [Meloidogyne enterolobii]
MIKTLKVAAKNSNIVKTPAEDVVYVTTQKKRQDAGVFYSPHFPLSFLPQDARVFYVTVALQR